MGKFITVYYCQTILVREHVSLEEVAPVPNIVSPVCSCIRYETGVIKHYSLKIVMFVYDFYIISIKNKGNGKQQYNHHRKV